MHRHPPTLPFADLRRMETGQGDRARSEGGAGGRAVRRPDRRRGRRPSPSLIASFREQGRAVLLVDHNVKGVAALVDRVLAMYLGERDRRGQRAER